jgi:branched-chain amino acid aminotransferase
METALLNYFVYDAQLRLTCDFNLYFPGKGVSIYEVLRVEKGFPLFLKEHIDRIFSSAALENIQMNLSRKFIRQSVKTLIDENRMSIGNIKFLFHRNPSGSNRFMAWVMPFFYPSARQYAEGVVAGSMQAERENPNAKKIMYNLRERADALMKKEHYWEVVYVNAQGFLTEGSRSNIFFIRGNKIFTPELSLVLPGITRAKVFALAAENGVSVEETKIRPEEMKNFNVCFLTGTSPKVLPVVQLNQWNFDVQHPLMHRLMLGYDRIVAKDLSRFKW